MVGVRWLWPGLWLVLLPPSSPVCPPHSHTLHLDRQRSTKYSAPTTPLLQQEINFYITYHLQLIVGERQWLSKIVDIYFYISGNMKRTTDWIVVSGLHNKTAVPDGAPSHHCQPTYHHRHQHQDLIITTTAIYAIKREVIKTRAFSSWCLCDNNYFSALSRPAFTWTKNLTSRSKNEYLTFVFYWWLWEVFRAELWQYYLHWLAREERPACLHRGGEREGGPG